jgi:hypothetical protein
MRANILPIFRTSPLYENHQTTPLPFFSISFHSSLVPSQPPPETCALLPAMTTVSVACSHDNVLITPYAKVRSWCHIPGPNRPSRPWRELTPNHHPSRARCWSPWSSRPSSHLLAYRVAVSHGAYVRNWPAA